MDKITHSGVASVFSQYPEHIRRNLLILRQMILQTAAETEQVDGIEETLKWGDPAYLTRNGSTIRVGWKQSDPDQYAMYFHCKTRLVETFRELYRDRFTFEANRAIVFQLGDPLPADELMHCIALSLTYHRRKHLPMLGV